MTERGRLIPYPAQTLPLEQPTVADMPLEQPTVADLPLADTGGGDSGWDPAVPATPAGLRLGRSLMSRRVTAGLPAGCAYRETADIICAGRGAAIAQLELWHSPPLCAALRGARIEPTMANCWVILMDGRLAAQHALRHRGPAIDLLAATASGRPPEQTAPRPEG